MNPVDNNIGKLPGTLIYTGEHVETETIIERISFDSSSLDYDYVGRDIEALPLDPDKNHWINVRGLTDIEKIKNIGKKFEIDHLILEDVLNTRQHPRVVFREGFLFMVMNSYELSAEGFLHKEQISFVYRDNVLITFQEGTPNLFIQIENRIKKGVGKVRKERLPYLFYLLVDIVFDKYFDLLNHVMEEAIQVEKELLEVKTKEGIQHIHMLKNHLLPIEYQLPMVKGMMLNFLKAGDYEEEISDYENYFQDLLDHVNKLVSESEQLNNRTTNLLNSLIAINDLRQNDIMRTLTLVSTIFLPLTFLAGVYGMNFKYMPELEYPNGYFILLGTMLVIAIFMFIFMRRKKWL